MRRIFPGRAQGPAGARGQDERLARLEARVDHLESLVEGVQDALHRERVRQDEGIAELDRRTQPDAMTRSLAKHARETGIE